MPKHPPYPKPAPAAQLAGCAAWFSTEAIHQRLHGPLAQIAAALDWEALRSLLAPLTEQAAQRNGGPDGFDPLALTAAHLLGHWHGLGDRALADAVGRRVDFMLFAGFAPDLPTPSASTLGRHRNRLQAAGILDVIHAEVNAACLAAGFTIKATDHALVDVQLKKRKGE